MPRISHCLTLAPTPINTSDAFLMLSNYTVTIDISRPPEQLPTLFAYTTRQRFQPVIAYRLDKPT